MWALSLLAFLVATGAEPAAPAAEQALLQSALDTAATFLTPESAPADAVALDVRACVAQALSDNGQARAAQERVLEQEAQVGQARAAKLPRISLQSTYAYIDGLPVDIYDRGFLGLIGANIDAQKDIWTTTLQLEQVLFSGGRIRNAIAAAEYLRTAQAWQREVTLDELEYLTKQAYYDAILAQALAQVAAESVGVFERHVSDARRMFDAGMVSRFELTRAETELGNRRAQQEAAAAAAKLARLNLLRLLAMPQDTAVALRAELAASPPAGDIDTLVATAQEQRAEVRALDAGLRAGERRVAAAKGEYLPSAGASIRYDEVQGGTSIQPEGLTLGLGLQWDVYTGGRRKYQVHEAEAQLRGLGHQRDALLDAVEFDVRQAHERMQTALAQIAAEQGTVSLGEEGLRLAQLRFGEGAGTASETLDAELAVTAARTSFVQALRDYAVAVAALEKAVGITWVARERSE